MQEKAARRKRRPPKRSALSRESLALGRDGRAATADRFRLRGPGTPFGGSASRAARRDNGFREPVRVRPLIPRVESGRADPREESGALADRELRVVLARDRDDEVGEVREVSRIRLREVDARVRDNRGDLRVDLHSLSPISAPRGESVALRFLPRRTDTRNLPRERLEDD
jgi:hypothetical protein